MKRSRNIRSTACGLRFRSLVPPALALLALLLVAPALFADAVRLKDGSLIFARAPYLVKGTRAIITLENGTVTQIPLAEVDVPGTHKYNRENYDNVIAIETPQHKGFQLAVPASRSGAVSSDSRPSVSPVLWGGPGLRGSRRLSRPDGGRSGRPSSP
jgi:hypothetical protein